MRIYSNASNKIALEDADMSVKLACGRRSARGQISYL